MRHSSSPIPDGRFLFLQDFVMNTREIPLDLSADAAHANGAVNGRVFVGRYQVLKVLKNGQDTETLLATDLTERAKVVIKTAATGSFSATARMRLEHEA